MHRNREFKEQFLAAERFTHLCVQSIQPVLVRHEIDADRIIDPSQWIIFGKARGMVESLVKKENGVYRNKLLDLAQHSLDGAQNRQRIPTEGLTAANVVDTAWGDVRYGWADSSTDETLIQDGSCAYTWKTEEGGQPFPLI